MQKPPLADPPESPRARELWLNHAAGYILFRDVRDYAREQIDPTLSETERAAVLKGIDDAVYGITMVLDGVPQPLANDRYMVSLQSELVLEEFSNGEWRNAERTSDFEGFCMGYHSWCEGDFGDDPIIQENAG